MSDTKQEPKFDAEYYAKLAHRLAGETCEELMEKLNKSCADKRSETLIYGRVIHILSVTFFGWEIKKAEEILNKMGQNHE